MFSQDLFDSRMYFLYFRKFIGEKRNKFFSRHFNIGLFSDLLNHEKRKSDFFSNIYNFEISDGCVRTRYLPKYFNNPPIELIPCSLSKKKDMNFLYKVG